MLRYWGPVPPLLTTPNRSSPRSAALSALSVVHLSHLNDKPEKSSPCLSYIYFSQTPHGSCTCGWRVVSHHSPPRPSSPHSVALGNKYALSGVVWVVLGRWRSAALNLSLITCYFVVVPADLFTSTAKSSDERSFSPGPLPEGQGSTTTSGR